jgi:2-phospho-L-lactate guanylyltransferase
VTPGVGWSVVVPLKSLDRGKSRLGIPAPLRKALVVAMARDVRDAVLACPQVAEIVIVTSDPRWRDILGTPELRFVADEPTDSLNGALRRGAASCRATRPGCAVAALTADLPALRPAELELALGHAHSAPTWFVPDAHGSGTTLYAARRHAPFRPQYGGGSRARHRAAGALEVRPPEHAGIRQDVDTVDDLERALSLRPGRHTRAALSAVAGIRPRPADMTVPRSHPSTRTADSLEPR